MRGYFAIGVEGISKAHNLGAVLRTAHAFGASFTFSIGATHKALEVKKTDTSRSYSHLPYYDWENLDAMVLPQNCDLVGIELTDDAVDLPSFRHPLNCAYVLGPEMGSLSHTLQDRCAHIVKIPTKFCINVSLAAALTCYDRTLSLGSYPDRPLMPGGPELGDPKTWPKFHRRRIRGRTNRTQISE